MESFRQQNTLQSAGLLFRREAGSTLCSRPLSPFRYREQFAELHVSVLFTPGSKPGVSPQQFESFLGESGAVAGCFHYFEAAAFLGGPDLAPYGPEWLFQPSSRLVDGAGFHDGFQYSESTCADNQFALIVFYPNFGADSEQHLKPSSLICVFTVQEGRSYREDINTTEM